MALRQKIENVPRWPTVLATADLPNVAGSPTQSSALQVGDECYVAGTVNALYVCTTATAGAAVWAPCVQLAGQLGGTAASPDVRGIRETAGPTLLAFGAIADGQALVRSGFAMLVGSQPDLAVVGEAQDGVEAVARARRRACVARGCGVAPARGADGGRRGARRRLRGRLRGP